MKNGKMIFEASCLGPIATAKIELRPLTVFVGHPNTGKSYMASMMYSFMRHLRSCFNGLYSRTPTDDLLSKMDLVKNDHAAIKKAIEDFGAGTFGAGHKYLHSLMKEKIYSAFNNKPGALRSQITRNHNVTPIQDLIQTGAKSLNFNFEMQDLHNQTLFSTGCEINENFLMETFVNDITLSPGSFGESNLRNKLDGILKSSWIFTSKGEGETLAFFLNKLLNELCIFFLRNKVPAVNRQIHYLSAARSTIMQMSALINESIIENVIGKNKRDHHKGAMSGMVADFIKTIDYIRGRGGENRDIWVDGDKISRQIEERVLCGTINVTDDGEALSRITYTPIGWNNDLPISRASSMVSELVPVTLYFRYILQPGDVLILEEPEAHVHPDAQLVLVKEISEAVNKGVFIVLTTHSEWITEEIDKLIALSDCSEKERYIRGKQIFALNEDDVGLWRFDKNSKDHDYTCVKEIASEEMEDLGFQSTYFDIGNEYAAMHNRSQMSNSESETSDG